MSNISIEELVKRGLLPPNQFRMKTKLPKFNTYRNKMYEDDEDDEDINIQDKIVIHEKEFANILSLINKCVKDWYFQYFPENMHSEFTPCCSEEEKDILRKCIILVEEHTDFKSKDIYMGVIEYYYYSIVLEYYASEENLFNCFDMHKSEYPKAVNVRDMITISDEPWASKVRRLINFAAKKGGKRLRHKLYRKKSYKKKRKTQKSRKTRRKHYN
jgi:hypothetical protein